QGCRDAELSPTISPPGPEVDNPCAREQDRVLDLGARDLDLVTDRRVRTDIGVLDACALADHRGSAEPPSRRSPHPSRPRRGSRPGSRPETSPSMRGLSSSSTSRLASSMSATCPASFHPPLPTLRST